MKRGKGAYLQSVPLFHSFVFDFDQFYHPLPNLFLNKTTSLTLLSLSVYLIQVLTPYSGQKLTIIISDKISLKVILARWLDSYKYELDFHVVREGYWEYFSTCLDGWRGR